VTTSTDRGAAFEAFILEHEYCGDLDGGVDGDRVWMTCTGRPGRSSRMRWVPGNPKDLRTKIEEESMYWIVTLIVGGVVGWLGSILMKTNAQMGIIANIVVGIIGSSLGFWLAGVLGLSTGGPIVGWIVAVLGAALLIFILKAVGIFT